MTRALRPRSVCSAPTSNPTTTTPILPQLCQSTGCSTYPLGSTGRPKGIVHLHHDMAYTHRSYAAHVLHLGADDRCFSVPKIFFAYAFGNSFTFPFSVGATTVLMPGRPEAGAVLDVIERFRPTVLFGLPTLYTALCHAEGIRDRDLGSLRLSISAAEVLSEGIYSGWKALTEHGPTEGLGSTEMLHIYLSNRVDDHRLGAAGAPVPGYEVRLLTPEGRPARPGEAGVMHVRGDSSAPCYWRKPDKTRETMRGEWIDTGDRFVERDGYYYFQGRADDLIRVSGQWVWPLEVEHCLSEHPDVRGPRARAPGSAHDASCGGASGRFGGRKRCDERAVAAVREGAPAASQVPAHRGIRGRTAEDRHREDRSAGAALGGWWSGRQGVTPASSLYQSPVRSRSWRKLRGVLWRIGVIESHKGGRQHGRRWAPGPHQSDAATRSPPIANPSATWKSSIESGASMISRSVFGTESGRPISTVAISNAMEVAAMHHRR